MMSRDEAERLWRRFHACGWYAYVHPLNVWGTRCVLLVTHDHYGCHRVSSERHAARLLAMSAQAGATDNG